MRGPDLRSLEIFRAVATEGSISKAALKLNRVQSNISTRIKQLERQVDKSLFLRHNRGLTLTPDGHLLLSYAERLLQLSMEASEALNGGKPSGVFRIGTMESTAAARLPEVLSRYHELYPDVQIVLETGTAGGLIDRLLNYDIEIAFVAEPVSFDRVSTQPVFEEQLILVAPKSFPPLKNPRDISGKTVVGFEAGCAYRRYLEDWLLEAGIVPGSLMAVSSYLAIFACVSAGTGYTPWCHNPFSTSYPQRGSSSVTPCRTIYLESRHCWRGVQTTSPQNWTP
ncbi:MAG: LysR family transcriptional regulator [Proteobacteria bacterium]|nr:LysR family transcriptional regulator [Pseudomonadota bacterium]